MTESDNRKVAIYSRKSKFTGKGDSVENQIEFCKKYIANTFHITDEAKILIYEDEGYSGKNIKRPQFLKMLESCKNKEIQAIVCYRLDRISRSISDFASLYKNLSDWEIEFHSASEPYFGEKGWGKAFLYMSSIFAELERDILAERVRDNLLALSKTGRCLGGTTPLGYDRKQIKYYIGNDGKTRTSYHLIKDDTYFSVSQLIFEKFMVFRSLTKLETYLLNNHYRTRNGKSFSRTGLRDILRNPVYASADKAIYEYYNELGCIITCESVKFDGKFGLSVYNKTDQSSGKSHKKHAYSEWIVAIGKHEPVLSGRQWVQVQQILDLNKPRNYHKPKSNTSLLSGLLFCANCGDYMRTKTNRRVDENGNKCFSYLCQTKEKSHGQLCDMNRPDGNLLDKMACDEIKILASRENKNILLKQLRQAKKQLLDKSTSKATELDHLNEEHARLDEKIKNLISHLADYDNALTLKYINEQINTYHEEKHHIEQKIELLNQSLFTQSFLTENFDILMHKLSSFPEVFDMMTVEEKREVIRRLLDKVVWNGTHVHLYLVGQNNQKTKPQ